MKQDSASEIVIVDLVELLLQELQKSKIPYCHWKSNIDLNKSFMGLGDLDLLIDRRYSSSFNKLVLGLDFKRAVVGFERQFPGIEDYLGWDRGADILIHLHVHYQLVLGATYLKSVHLPIEQVFLDNRRKQGPIMISAPECELPAFVLRHILRIRMYDAMIGRNYSKSMLEELDFLSAKAPTDDLSELLTRCGISETVFEKMKSALRSQSPWRILRSKRKLERNIRQFQRFGRFTRFARPAIVRLNYRWRHMFGGAPLGSKPASGGIIIAVIGSDGSGKSSMVSELDKWLRNNYSVRTYHLGKPRQSPLSYVMLRFAGILGKLGAKTNLEPQRLPSVFASVLSQLFIARDRRKTYYSIRKSVGQGQIAIIDRFPIRGVNMDGISSISQYRNSKNGIIRWLTKQTARYYQDFTEPDLLLTLRVSLDVAAKRRPNDSQEYLKGRIDAVKEIKSGKNVLVIDAEREHCHVIEEAKEFVWGWL